MARSHLPAGLRAAIRARAGGHCEYCRLPDAPPNFAPFHCDHCVPEVDGGATVHDNLAWACPACNGAKASASSAPDPQTGRPAPLFNPRRQRWASHFRWSDDRQIVVGRTPTGRATAERLRMNRPAARESRAILALLGLHP